MNAIELLKKQHREVEAIFAEMESNHKKGGKGREQKALCQQVINQLLVHAQIEEKVLYPEAKEFEQDLTLEAYEEHDAAKSLMRKILKSKVTDETFFAKVTVLKEMIEHHVKEEEKEMFPKLETELGEERLNEIGDHMQALADRLVSGGGKKKTPKGSRLKLAKAS